MYVCMCVCASLNFTSHLRDMAAVSDGVLQARSIFPSHIVVMSEYSKSSSTSVSQLFCSSDKQQIVRQLHS